MINIDNQSAVSNLINYVTISAIMVVIIGITFIMVTNVMIKSPEENVRYYSFVDISNAVSTRVVDIYSIAPHHGDIYSGFDIPDEVAGKDFTVNVQGTGTDQNISVFRDSIRVTVSLAGIGINKPIGTGDVPASQVNQISYSYNCWGAC